MLKFGKFTAMIILHFDIIILYIDVFVFYSALKWQWM